MINEIKRSKGSLYYYDLHISESMILQNSSMIERMINYKKTHIRSLNYFIYKIQEVEADPFLSVRILRFYLVKLKNVDVTLDAKTKELIRKFAKQGRKAV